MNDTASGAAISKHDKLMFWGCFIALITTAFAFVSRLFLLGARDCTGELDSCVVTEWFFPDAENHIIDLQDAISG